MTGPATTKLLIPSVVIVPGTDSNPERGDDTYGVIAGMGTAVLSNNVVTLFFISCVRSNVLERGQPFALTLLAVQFYLSFCSKSYTLAV